MPESIITTPGGIVVAHADHGLCRGHFDLIDTALAGWDGQFRIFGIKLPQDLLLPSALYGPLAGDAPIGEGEVTYVVRGGRKGPSRLIDLPSRPSDNMVVICGPHEGQGVIYTAHGGPDGAQREWWDSPTPADAIAGGKFWSEHALASQSGGGGGEGG